MQGRKSTGLKEHSASRLGSLSNQRQDPAVRERREQTPRLLPGSECPALSLVPVQPCSRSAPKPTHPLRTESEALNSLPQLAQL